MNYYGFTELAIAYVLVFVLVYYYVFVTSGSKKKDKKEEIHDHELQQIKECINSSSLNQTASADDNNPEIIIVGAGVAGSALAYALGKVYYNASHFFFKNS